MDDVILNKAAIIERCLKRIRDEYSPDPALFRTDLKTQDAVILNIQRACEACIDLAMHLVRVHKLGVPQESRDAFRTLEKNGIISKELSSELQNMVGFRNIAIDDYQTINLDIVESIIHKNVNSISEFASLALSLSQARQQT